MANAMQKTKDLGMSIPAPGIGPGGIDLSLVNPKVSQYAQNNPEEFSQDIFESVGQADPELLYSIRSALVNLELPMPVVDALLVMVETLMQDPVNYSENRQNFIKAGVPEEIIPPVFDPMFLTGMQMALTELKRAQKPQQFAKGGIVELKPIAKEMAKMGRNGDTMLAHITPSEARLLRLMGGSGTINPHTGLPEFFRLSDLNPVKIIRNTVNAVGDVIKGAGNVVKEIVKPIASAVKKIASSPIGKIVLTVAAVYFMGPAGLNVAGGLGLTGSVALGVNTALASTAVNLAGGMKFKEAIKAGAISGLTAGTMSAITGTLPAGYGAPSQITPTAGGIPAMGTGDYLSSGDATSLLEAQAAESAGAAAAGGVGGAVPGSMSAVPGSMSAAQVDDLLKTGVEAPTLKVSAPEVQVPKVGLPQANIPDVTETFGQPVRSFGPQVPSSLGGTAIPETGATAAPTSALDKGIGALKSAYETVSQPIKNIYDEYLSPSRGMPTEDQIRNKIAEISQDAADKGLSIGYKDAREMAVKALSPGLISQYAPLALTGTAALMATNAFTPKQPPPPGLVDMDYMRTGTKVEPIMVDIGGVNTITAPDVGYGPKTGSTSTSPENIGYGSTSFYNFNPSGYGDSGQVVTSPRFQVRDPLEYLNLNFLNKKYARGGIASLNKPRTYPRKTGAINGPGTETSDSIPALLSDGEFVFTAKAVRGAGGGSRRAGAKRMYAMMKALEKKSNG